MTLAMCLPKMNWYAAPQTVQCAWAGVLSVSQPRPSVWNSLADHLIRPSNSTVLGVSYSHSCLHTMIGTACRTQYIYYDKALVNLLFTYLLTYLDVIRITNRCYFVCKNTSLANVLLSSRRIQFPVYFRPAFASHCDGQSVAIVAQSHL